MNSDQITLNEVMNDGSIVYLYFNRATGLYMAYGFSAFNFRNIAQHKSIDAVESYSLEMAMPVVQVSKEQLSKVTEQGGDVISFKTDSVLDREEYKQWVQVLR